MAAAVAALIAIVTITALVQPAGAAVGDITTIAGNAVGGYNGDGIAAESGQLYFPTAMTTDAHGNVIVADYGNNRVRVVAQSASNPGYGIGGCAGACTWSFGDVYTIAGNGTAAYNGDGIGATTAALSVPEGVVTDSQGNLLIADSGNARVRLVAVSAANPGYLLAGCAGSCAWTPGDIYTIAGNGVFGPYGGDGVSATSAPLDPTAVVVDSQRNLVIADFSSATIRVVAESAANPGYALAGCSGPCTWIVGDIYTIAGVGGTAGYDGDGGPAVAAQLTVTPGLSLDPTGNVVFADGNNRIRVVAVSASNPGYLLAGSGCEGPCAWTVGNVFTVAGTGAGGYTGDGISATAAELNTPYGVAIDSQGNVVVADSSSALVRVVAVSAANPGYSLAGCAGPCSWTAGNIYTVAGNTTLGFSGDDGPATAAALNIPYGVAVGTRGDLFIADTYNNRIREVAVYPNAVLDVAATTPPLGATVTAGSDTAWTIQIDNPSLLAAQGVTLTLDANADGTTPLSFDNAAINLARGLPPSTPTCVPGAGSTVVCSAADVPAKSSEAFTAFVATPGLTVGSTISGHVTASAANGNSASGVLSTVTVVACASGCTKGVAAPGAPIATPPAIDSHPTQQILALPANAAGSSVLPPVNVALSSINPGVATVSSDRRLCPVAAGATHCAGQISSVIGNFAKYLNETKPIRVTIVARWGSSIPPGRILMMKNTGGDPLFLIPCVRNSRTLRYNTPCVLPETHTGSSAAGNLVTRDVILFTGLDVHFSRRIATGGTKISAPAAPTAVAATAGSGSVTLKWKAPTVTNGAGVTSYVVTELVAGKAVRTITFASPKLTQPIYGLTNGTAYTFKVAAGNVAGTGAASAASAAKVVGAPGAPTAVHATKTAAGHLQVTFTPPTATNGGAITGYTATCTSSNLGVTKSKTGTASPLTVVSLTAGKKYTCTVKAKNSRGLGPPSAKSAAVTA